MKERMRENKMREWTTRKGKEMNQSGRRRRIGSTDNISWRRLKNSKQHPEERCAWAWRQIPFVHPFLFLSIHSVSLYYDEPWKGAEVIHCIQRRKPQEKEDVQQRCAFPSSNGFTARGLRGRKEKIVNSWNVYDFPSSVLPSIVSLIVKLGEEREEEDEDGRRK